MTVQDARLAGLVRRCLTARYVVRSRNKQLYAALLERRDRLNEYFEKMGARLVIQDALGVAYLDPDPQLEDEMDYKLGRRIALTPLESLLLIHLRQKRMDYYAGDIDREAPWISAEDMRRFLAEFKIDREDRKFQQKFEKAVEKFQEHQILFAGENGMEFEISPVCDLILPADEIDAGLRRARAYFERAGAAASDSERRMEGDPPA